MDSATVASSSDPYTVRGLLSRIRCEENRRIKDIAALNFQLQKQKKKSQKLEGEVKLERDKRRFKENELIHLRLALDRSYETIDDLEKKLAQCKEYHVHIDEVDKAEERLSTAHAKLLEKESELYTTLSKLEGAKKSNDALRRESTVLKAKYEQLLKSEHTLALEVRELQSDLNALKHANEQRMAMVSNLNSAERDETVQTLLRLGRNMPACVTSLPPYASTPLSSIKRSSKGARSSMYNHQSLDGETEDGDDDTSIDAVSL